MKPERYGAIDAMATDHAKQVDWFAHNRKKSIKPVAAGMLANWMEPNLLTLEYLQN
jgi:hypothetical protein